MSIEIKEVVALTGSPGLYRIVKADDRAIVVESMDEKRKRQLIKGNMLVSKLKDISIYTDEDSEPLVNILKTIKEKYGEELPVTKKSSKNELMDFLAELLPNFDDERVYPSNVKKLISWYNILQKFDVNFEIEEEEEESDDSEKEETEVSEDAE